jgi:hypothetical protein
LTYFAGWHFQPLAATPLSEMIITAATAISFRHD